MSLRLLLWLILLCLATVVSGRGPSIRRLEHASVSRTSTSSSLSRGLASLRGLFTVLKAQALPRPAASRAGRAGPRSRRAHASTSGVRGCVPAPRHREPGQGVRPRSPRPERARTRSVVPCDESRTGSAAGGAHHARGRRARSPPARLRASPRWTPQVDGTPAAPPRAEDRYGVPEARRGVEHEHEINSRNLRAYALHGGGLAGS